MKKYYMILVFITFYYSCNTKQNENENSFQEEKPLYEGVDNNQNEDFYTLGDTTQNKESQINETDNEYRENIKGEISQDSAIYEGIQE